MRKDFFRQHGFQILFVVVFLLSFIWMGTKATIQSNSNSVEDWLPNQYQQTRDYRWFLEHFPFESFVVISWEGCTLDDDRVELFARKLVPEQSIDNFSLLANTTNLDAELDVRKVSDRVQKAVESNRKEAEKNPAESKAVTKDTELPTSEQYFKSVMTGPRLVRLLEESYSKTPQLNMSKEELHQEICQRLKGTLIGPDGKSTALIVTLSAGRRDGKYLKKVLDRIREISVECGLPNTVDVKTGNFANKVAGQIKDLVKEIREGRHPRMDGVIMGGPPTDNVALDQEGERTLFRLAGLCALIGGTLAFLCLRSIRLTMFVFWISVLAAGVALAIVSLTGGTCDSILLSMPALVYVLAMSGAIHLINYYHDAIRENGIQGAPERALEHGFSPCFFAQLTTAIGLGSLFVSNLVPITKFGFYSAIGVMTTLLLLFLYLPSLLYFYPSKKFAQKYGGKGLDEDHGFICNFWANFGRILVNHHNLVAIICCALMVFFAMNLSKVKTSVKMMSFFSPDADIIANYSWLEEKLGPLVPMELVVSFDNSRLSRNTFSTVNRLSLINRLCDTLKERLSEDVGGTLSVGMFAPDIDTLWKPDSMAYRMASAIAGKSIDENRESLKDYLAVEGNPSLDEIAQCLAKQKETLQTEFDGAKKSLAVKMKEAGLDIDRELAQIQIKDPTAKRNPFLAELQKLDEIRRLMKDNDDLISTLDKAKPTLIEGKLTDLNGIMSLNTDRSYRNIQTESIAKLQESCEIWRRNCGVELWRISIRVWSLKKDIDYSKFITDVQSVVEPILKEKSEEIITMREKAGLPPLISSVQIDPEKLAEFKAETAKASGMSSEESVSAPDLSMGLAHTGDIIYPAGISAKYTGMVPLVYKTQHELINGLVESLIMAFFLICIVLMFVLKSIPGGIVAMIPNMFPVICVFGYMAWRGILVDVGTMMTASVALGVAIDDTMHYLTWFSDGIHGGKTPKEAAIAAYRRCAAAMTESTIICGFGLSAFAFSTFVPTQKFGILMLAILVVALIGDLIFLPALLTGPLGRFFLIKRRRKHLDAKNADE